MVKPFPLGEKGLGGGGACEVILVVDMVESRKSVCGGRESEKSYRRGGQ
jgi:hypothetical protein